MCNMYQDYGILSSELKTPSPIYPYDGNLKFSTFTPTQKNEGSRCVGVGIRALAVLSLDLRSKVWDLELPGPQKYVK